MTSALAGGEWSASRPGRFIPEERAHGTPWIVGWVDPIAGLEDVENRKFFILLGLELRPLGRPSRNQSLYRPRYPGSLPSNHIKFLCALLTSRIADNFEERILNR
jgi:hypothetical protein